MKRLATLAVESGPRGLFAGLGPRMLMTAGLVSGQFFGYSLINRALNTKPAVTIHKD